MLAMTFYYPVILAGTAVSAKPPYLSGIPEAHPNFRTPEL